MRRSFAGRAVLFAILALFAAGEVLAQFGGVPGGGMGRRGGGMRGGGGDTEKTPRPAQGESRADTLQVSLEELRIDLKLDSAQQAAWNAYADKLAAMMSDLARERGRSQPGAMRTEQSAPQQLDRMVNVAQNRATAIEEVATAAKALYSTLSVEQRAVADARLAHVTTLALAQQPGDPSSRARGAR